MDARLENYTFNCLVEEFEAGELTGRRVTVMVNAATHKEASLKAVRDAQIIFKAKEEDTRQYICTVIQRGELVQGILISPDWENLLAAPTQPERKAS